MTTPNYEAAIEVFHRAMDYMRGSHLCGEIEWQRSVSFESFTEQQFLRECAWVILCSGFREETVRRYFDYISLVHSDWESAEAVLDSYPLCVITASRAIDNRSKLEAIVAVARRVNGAGFLNFKEAILRDPISELCKLPYVGEVTSWHLAKNLGLNVAKPDRHLVRISENLGFTDAHALCQSLALLVGEQVKVVDLVIWRYLADNPGLRKHWCGQV